VHPGCERGNFGEECRVLCERAHERAKKSVEVVHRDDGDNKWCRKVGVEEGLVDLEGIESM
jgi:hypothetical protein